MAALTGKGRRLGSPPLNQRTMVFFTFFAFMLQRSRHGVEKYFKTPNPIPISAKWWKVSRFACGGRNDPFWASSAETGRSDPLSKYHGGRGQTPYVPPMHAKSAQGAPRFRLMPISAKALFPISHLTHLLPFGP